jgi:hypothetical protein
VNPDEDRTRAFYTALRAELTQRLVLRDQLLVAYVVAAGSYSAYLITFIYGPNAEPKPSLLLIGMGLGLPLICVVFSRLIIQHHVVIHQIAKYLAEELYPNVEPPEFSASLSIALSPLKSRFWPQFLISVLPAALSIYITVNSLQADMKAWAFGIVALLIEAAAIAYIAEIHWRANAFRNMMQNQNHPNDKTAKTGKSGSARA